MLECLYEFPLLVNHRLLLLLELKHIVVQLWRRVAVVDLRELEPPSSLLEPPNLSLCSLLLQGWINVSLLLRRFRCLRSHDDPFREPHGACLFLRLLLITVTEYFGQTGHVLRLHLQLHPLIPSAEETYLLLLFEIEFRLLLWGLSVFVIVLLLIRRVSFEDLWLDETDFGLYGLGCLGEILLICRLRYFRSSNTLG